VEDFVSLTDRKRGGRLVLLVLVGFVLTVISACASGGNTPTASTNAPTVYMIGSVTNNTFWAAVKRGFEQGGKDFHLNTIYEAPDVHSSAGSIPLINAAIASKPAGIAINYTDKSIEAPTLAALDGGAKVILYNNNRFEAAGGDSSTATTNSKITSLAYVGEDSLVNARRLGEAFAASVKPGTTVLIVDPVPGVQVLALRRQGIEAAMHAHGINTDYLPGFLDEAKNLATIGAYMQAHPGIGGIVGLGDPTANPASLYIQQNNLTIPTAAFDVDSEAIKFIKAGIMKDATDQQPYLQGYISAMNLALMLNDHLFPVSVNTGSFIVTQANVAEVEAAVASGTA
jgi:ABC-type sugar transport system substrate-binding protein